MESHREIGDPELTQAESDATSAGESRFSKLIRRAGMAAILGAAALHAESAPAQQRSSTEVQNMQQIHHEFQDENHCKVAMELILQEHPTLAPLFDGATVREADTSKAGEFGDRMYYVYLPKYDLVLNVQFNNFENNPHPDSSEELDHSMYKGMHELAASLYAGLSEVGLIDIVRNAAGKVELVPRQVKQAPYGVIPPNWEDIKRSSK